MPVVPFVTGEIVALQDDDHAAYGEHASPIQLGISGGWRYDLANGYCCGGTLGALIQKVGSQNILSNYHVFEADIVAAATTGRGGDRRLHHSAGPDRCELPEATADFVANLSTLSTSSLPSSNVDCSIAQIITGMVRTTARSSRSACFRRRRSRPTSGQLVKKSGRTTGLTRSYVSGMNATISVRYENECAGDGVHQDLHGPDPRLPEAEQVPGGGDSGSLMVQDVTTNPKAIGLLFAGSTSIAVANPIAPGARASGATMVGI